MLTVQEKVKSVLSGVESDGGNEAAGFDPVTPDNLCSDRLNEEPVVAMLVEHFFDLRNEVFSKHGWIQLAGVFRGNVGVGDPL